MEAVFIFPHQIFENHPGLKKNRLILLIEDSRFFSDFSFHKKKLILHRATLKSFQNNLKRKGFQTYYVEKDLDKTIQELQISSIHVVEFDDISLSEKITKLAKKRKINVQFYASPGFLTSTDEFLKLFEGREAL
jgi:deoxyribodipyrimidine photolyase-related protein